MLSPLVRTYPEIAIVVYVGRSREYGLGTDSKVEEF